MTVIQRKQAADAFVPWSAEHFIARECDACDRTKEYATRVVMVDTNQGVAVSVSSAGVVREYRTERFGFASPGKTHGLVAVEWGGQKHEFDRVTGKCAETTDGLMRGWELHPFEVAKNKDISVDNYGRGGQAPIERIPTFGAAQPSKIEAA